jgi:hypothetical protein
MDDQTRHIVSKVGARDFGRCPFNADSSDEQTHLALLCTKNRLDAGAGFGFGRPRAMFASMGWPWGFW